MAKVTRVNSKPELDESLLPFFQEWKSGTQYSLWDYLSNESNYDMAAAFSKLFWPDFVEMDGCIFLAENYARVVMPPEWFERELQEDPRGLERFVNYVNLPYFFAENGISGMKLIDPETNLYGPEVEVFPRELDVYLAQVLMVCWKHALQETFPARSFEFFYDVEKNLVDPKITFCQAEG
ncbi:MAG TPA: hypothetical protein VFR15_02810 [Chloroflexia bacterium]|nr:hypothetical protein [Chloroflexia bacterium]